MPTLLPITLLFNFGIQAEETYAQEGIGVSEARGPRYTQRIHEDLDSLAYALKTPARFFQCSKRTLISCWRMRYDALEKRLLVRLH